MDEKLNYLLDTCILIDYLRGEPSVHNLLVKNSKIKLSMSTITMMELIIGAFNKREIYYIQKAFKEIDIIYIDNDISEIAENLIIKYSKSHNLQINDALIAATSIKMDIELLTFNVSDYKFIPEIKLCQDILIN
ncbi:MAG: type II toxin-antitoxin system VapC family toxin [Treponema sp.]|nr:type II toxin-antitoxin system VapC family toxin [Treponema sp.]